MTKERARVLLAEYARSSETVKTFCEGVGMHTWLTDVLHHINPHPINKVEELLPHNWAKQ